MQTVRRSLPRGPKFVRENRNRFRAADADRRFAGLRSKFSKRAQLNRNRAINHERRMLFFRTRTTCLNLAVTSTSNIPSSWTGDGKVAANCNGRRPWRSDGSCMALFKKEPRSYEIQGHVLKCNLCGHDEFHKREGQLNTSMATFFKMDWANTSAVCFVCDRCGQILWFLPK